MSDSESVLRNASIFTFLDIPNTLIHNIRISKNNLVSDLVCADDNFKSGIVNALGQLMIFMK